MCVCFSVVVLYPEHASPPLGFRLHLGIFDCFRLTGAKLAVPCLSRLENGGKNADFIIKYLLIEEGPALVGSWVYVSVRSFFPTLVRFKKY